MPGVRERARAALLEDVGRVARRHLAEHGASELSVRAISRELGLAPSALYRYYPSRDALLTRLIIESYDDLGDAVDAAGDAVDPGDVRGRFVAEAVAIREWAIDHPHEYALIYGSPVPGYAAPEDTVVPATRVIRRLVASMVHGDPSALPDVAKRPLSPLLQAQVDHVDEISGGGMDPHAIAFAVIQWATYFGMISFELFGTYRNTFDDAGDLYRHAVELAADALGLPGPEASPADEQP